MSKLLALALALVITLAIRQILGGTHDSAAEAGEEAQPGVRKLAFGKTADGTPVDLYVLTNPRGVQVKIATYGGIITEILVPDRGGKLGDVVLGFEKLDGYLAGHPFFGCITGRVANRIARGKFMLDGKDYTLATNNGPNHLHGGLKGFDKKVWAAEPVTGHGEAGVKLSYRSSDGEEGYPGNLSTTVTYALTDQNELRIDYAATTDKATPINLTNHTYFNLSGGKSADVLGHELRLAADLYTPVDDSLIPTGEIKPVRGTPLDFTTPAAIGARIDQLKGKPGGYDHNFVLRRGSGTGPALAARVREPLTGRVLEVLTTEPGVQLYTGNYLDGKTKGKADAVYGKHAGFCLETQHFPDSVNRPSFPSVILRPGAKYSQRTIFRFSVVE